MLINIHWKGLYQKSVFGAVQNSKMAATVDHSLTLDPMGNVLDGLLFGND